MNASTEKHALPRYASIPVGATVCIASLKTFRLGDMASFACHDDRSFSTKSTPIVLDTITNGTVHEPIARSDN